MQNKSTPVLVVAVALIAADGRVLMQRRRLGRAHGGLWEFPGGKVEPGEAPLAAAVREIDEELGVRIDPGALAETGFAADNQMPGEGRLAHVILLYTCRCWQGEPQCHDGEEIGWIAPQALAGLQMPPLDYPLAKALLRAI